MSTACMGNGKSRAGILTRTRCLIGPEGRAHKEVATLAVAKPPYDPVNRGARFSLKAMTPSTKSADPADSCWIWASSSSWSAIRS
jgi:hypothetical protein